MAEKSDQINSDYAELIKEMETQFFDTIRFASYRTACKILFVQKKSNFHLVDIWNVIDAFRQATFCNQQFTYTTLEQLLSYIFEQLNKRLPPSQNVDVASSTRVLYGFLIQAYDRYKCDRLDSFPLKIALSTLSAGKLQDKLRFMFSLVSDTNSGRLLPPLFRRFLKDLLQLACSVQEQQFYQFDEQLIAGMFGRRLLCTVTLTEFTQLFFAATGPPPILSWFVILHKMTQVEYTVHHCSCSCCGRSELVGFRYKCQKCFNYNLCQLCFWQGKATGSHNPETHSCKEYLHWRSASKQLSDSLRRSFRLKSSSKSRLHLSEQPATIPSKSLIVHSPQTQSIVLDTISPFIPSSPAASQRSPQHFPVISNYSPSLNGSESIVNRLPETCSFQTTPLNSTLINEYQRYGPSYATDLYEGHQNSHRERSNWNDLDDYGRASMTELIAAAPYTLDEEHRLIARYAMNLARTGSSRTASRTQKNVSESSSGQDFTATNSCSSNLTALAAFETQLFGTLPVDPTVLHQEQLISELEAKNREMMREIVRLREFSPSSDYNSMGNERPPNGYFNSAGHSSGSSCSAHSQADVIEELHILRDRKDELEMHLESLQDSRVELKNQLHHLIGLSKNYSQKISLPASACSSLSQASGRRMQMLLSDKTVSKDGSLDSTLNRVADALEREKSSYHSSNPIELAGSIEDKLKIGSAGSSQSKLMLSTDRKDIDDSFNQRWKTSSDAVLPLKPDSKEAEKVVTDTTKHSKIPIPNGGLNKSISQARKETSNNRSASEEVGIDKVEYNNILNRNIDDILNKNRNAAQQRTRRINKYMHKYDLANGADCDRLAAQPMKMNVTNGRNEDDSRSIASSRSIVQQSSLEKWDAASSDLSTSSSVIPRCDVKSQPLMCFSSIAYVNANRALQMQQLSVNRRQRPGLSNVLEPLPTATDVSTSGLLFGDPIEHDAPYMFDRVVEQLVNGNGNTFQANEEGAEEEDEDNNEEDEVVEAMERALEEELEANSFEVKLNHHLELLNEISVGSTYEWTSNRPDRLASYIYSPNFLM